jgi:outer membrane receptor for ferrienterochelin and colicin
MLKYLFTIGIILLIISSTFAGTTGKIAGRVTDADTNEPLIGANVIVKDSYFGASTDLDGYYAILNLPPGTYTLQVEYIGYNTTEITNVKVSIDLTTPIDISLSEQTLETSETITIVAERQKIQKDLTATTSVVDDDVIAALPVTEVSEVLTLQAGYVDGHMRGGRSGEVAYWVDGIPVTDAYDGGTVVDVNKDMIQELQVVSGAFNAEYGNAMSGIVNMVTKGGSNDFGGSFTTYLGDYYSTHTDIFWDIDNFNPLSIYNFDGSVHGAIVKDKVFYYLNGRHIYFGGWYKGKEEYRPNNVSLIIPLENNEEFFVKYRESDGQGSGDYVPMNWNRKNYGQMKLIYKMTPTINILSNTIYDDVEYRDYDRAYKLNPKGDLKRFRTGVAQMFKLTHILSPETFYDLALTGFQKDYKEYTYKDPHDPRYVHPSLNDPPLNFSFKTGGTNLHRFNRETFTLLGKLDLTSQISKNHQIKTGAEYRQYELKYDDYTLQPTDSTANFNPYEMNDSPYITTEIPNASTRFRALYTRKPEEASFYVQDKMEFNDFILNIGIRFDYFDAKAKIPSDPQDPDINDPRKQENINKSYEERLKYWYKDTDPKFQFSPRIGAAFPISSTGKVYFSYGYFFQRPSFELLYTNPDYYIPDTEGGAVLVGNPNLDPEKTVQGELGIQQEIFNNVLVDATIFFRDIRDLTGTRAELIELPGLQRYAMYSNSDLGLVKGFILALTKRMSSNFAASLDYTFQIAEGTASDPEDALDSQNADALPEVQLISLNWDQRHTINTSLTYASTTWGASSVIRYGSGLPYTPQYTNDISILLTNKDTKPPTTTVDLKLYKDFKISTFDFTFFTRVFNLFDTLNETNVYDDSGRAGYTTDEVNARASNPQEYVNSLDKWFTNATHYSEPRRIEFGLTVSF